MTAIVLLGLFFAGFSPGPAQQLPVDAAPQGARTGFIAGQVVDSTGAPVPDAIVRLSLPKFNPSLPTTPKGRIIADREGRFYFGDLPPGDYYLNATKEGYAGGTYGQRRPSGESLRVQLAEGERRTDAGLTLWKYAVIAGTVVDEAGEPVVGVGVRALARNIVGGRERFVASLELSPSGGAVALTDDRGMFRLANLLPGSRRVRLVHPASDGSFRVLGLPAGDYFLAALADLEPGEWNDPTVLATLVQWSLKVTLRDGEATTQDVRIGG